MEKEITFISQSNIIDEQKEQIIKELNDSYSGEKIIVDFKEE